MPFNEDGSRKTIAYKKSSGFKMTGSPHKTGSIEGTSGHASALKAKWWQNMFTGGMAGARDLLLKKRQKQTTANMSTRQDQKELERQANMAANTNAPQPTPNAPIADPNAPIADPNAPLGSEGAVQPDLEELGTN